MKVPTRFVYLSQPNAPPLSLHTSRKLQGPISLTSLKLSSAEDYFVYRLNLGHRIETGRGMKISSNRSIRSFSTCDGRNDLVSLVGSASAVAMEYTSMGGEGQIRPGSAVSGEKEYAYFFAVKDHLGSTRMVVTDQNRVTEAVAYAPYGEMEEVLAGSADQEMREKFTGKEFDTEGSENGGSGIGLFYFGARYYDANIGVWASTDPKYEFWNLFRYCANNPINLFDPDGMEIENVKAFENEKSFASIFKAYMLEYHPNIWNYYSEDENVHSPYDIALNIFGQENIEDISSRMMLGILDADGCIAELATLADFVDQVGGYTPAAPLTTGASLLLSGGNAYLEYKKTTHNKSVLTVDFATTIFSLGANVITSKAAKPYKIISNVYSNIMYGVRVTNQSVNKE